MLTQEQIRGEIDRLLNEDRLDEVETLIDQLTPVGRDEFKRRLDEAPLDEEPLTPAARRSLDEAWSVLRGGPNGSTAVRPAG